MALFTVNRFLGKADLDDNVQQSSPFFDKLKERIQQRQADRIATVAQPSDEKLLETGKALDVTPKTFSRPTKRRLSVTDLDIADEDDDGVVSRDQATADDITASEGSAERQKRKRKRTRKRRKTEPTSEDGDEQEQRDIHVDGDDLHGDEDGQVQSDAENAEEKDADGEVTKSTSFKVLGREGRRCDITPLRASLPDWLRNPTALSSQLDRHQVAVDSIPLALDMRKALSKHGIKTLFPGKWRYFVKRAVFCIIH